MICRGCHFVFVPPMNDDIRLIRQTPGAWTTQIRCPRCASFNEATRNVTTQEDIGSSHTTTSLSAR
jgi:RNase P subunit RPR2